MGERPWLLQYIPDTFKTQRMCDNAVNHSPYMLEDIPDWFVTRQQINRRYDDDYCYDDDDEIIEWCNGYQKRKAQKAKIKEELLPITWHLDRVMDHVGRREEEIEVTDGCFKII